MCEVIFSQIDEIKMIELYSNVLILAQTYGLRFGFMHTHLPEIRLNHKPKWHSIRLNESTSCDPIRFGSIRFDVINLHVCLY